MMVSKTIVWVQHPAWASHVHIMKSHGITWASHKQQNAFKLLFLTYVLSSQGLEISRHMMDGVTQSGTESNIWVSHEHHI